MDLWLASSNQHKLQEIRQILEDTPFQVRGTEELSFYSSPPENGESFEANARIKAKFLKALKNEDWVVADDSGLECEGLNNMPGIHSARYAGENASDKENTAKLLKMLQIRTTNRKARFVCCLVLMGPNGEEEVFEGSLSGSIATSQKGTHGFGYDPVFIPDGSEKTLAEISSAEKNQISHRFQALKKMKAYLSDKV